MGKRRFNEKGRQQVETIIDNTETKKIKVVIDSECKSDYEKPDDANLLVLPSKKRPTKIKRETTVVTRILSKKQRKRLEKIVDQKKKKENHSTLVSALAAVQATPEELKNYVKISSIQTKGLKQHFKEQKFGVTPKSDSSVADSKDKGQRIKSLVGTRKQRLALLRSQEVDSNNDDEDVSGQEKRLNTIGFDEDTSSDEGDQTVAEEKIEPTTNIQDSSDAVPQDTCTIEQNLSQKSTELEANTNKQVSRKLSSVKVASESDTRRPAVYVPVVRDPSIQAARLKLPILAEEQEIMEIISQNSIVILTGETGSGKTTQVPQFLYEAGYATSKRGMIAITEPRRVAAIAMSKRVATEMSLSTDIVSYLIRFEGNVTDETRIKFVTDGVLLKEIEHDFTLSTYSVVILDEAHERSVYTDILVGLLSRIVLLRQKTANPLKLIIMSATMRVNDFTENKLLFSEVPPVINVESRQFPVTVHFSKTTASDYLREAFQKTVKIHAKLPEGGILVFLTGQKEVNYMVKKLRKAFPFDGKEKTSETTNTNDSCLENESDDEDAKLQSIINPKKAAKLDRRRKKLKQIGQKKQHELPKINLDNYNLLWDDTEADQKEDNEEDNGSDGEGHLSESEGDDEQLADVGLKTNQPLWVLPLYSILSSEQQQKVFEAPPEGTRLCVVATNVAETSLTIPGIKYVVDCGRQKTKLYDKVTGVTAFVVTYISKASANQRAGRAGRVAPGHCYRLYSSAVFNDEFVDFAVPEIQKKPVDDLMLQMKCMGIDKVVNFPFPSPPDRTQLQVAEASLVLMEALEECIINSRNRSQTLTRVTELGKTIAAFPVAPRFGKMLALSHQHNLLPYAICMVAALSVPEVLQEGSTDNNRWRQKRKAWAGTNNSLLLGDPMILLRAVGAAEFANSQGRLVEFCAENGIRLKAIKEIRKLRVQLTNEVNANLRDLNLTVDPKLCPPSDAQAKLLRQLMLIGMADRIARKVPETEVKLKADKLKLKHAYNLPEMAEPVFLQSSSALKKQNPEWVCYQEAYETTIGEGSKMFIRGITAIEPEWLLQLVPKYCNIIKVLDDPQPTYDSTGDSIKCYVQATIGKSGWVLPVTQIEMPVDIGRYRFFCKFLLAGAVYAKLKRFSKSLLSSPDLVLKPHSSSVSRINVLLKTVQQNEVHSRLRLDQLWIQNKSFLLNEYLDFLPTSCHEDVRAIWPPSS